MPVQIVELAATRVAPDGGYPGGVFVDVILKNPGKFLPTPYRLTIEYFDPSGKNLYTDSDRGFLRAEEEKGIHSESSWSASRVRARVSPFGLGLLVDSEEVDIQ